MTNESEIGAELAKQLPSVFPRDPESGNYKLFQVVGHEFDDTVNDIDSVDRASTVQYADTVDQLEELGKLVEINPRENENREKYRSRVISEYQLATSEGTFEDVLTSLSVILNVDQRRIDFVQYEEPKTIGVILPKDKLDESELSNSEIADRVNDLTAATVRVESQINGTLEYVSPQTYQDIQDGNDTWSNYPGYDGLDTNGNKKNNPDAGTFGGTLE